MPLIWACHHQKRRVLNIRVRSPSFLMVSGFPRYFGSMLQSLTQSHITKKKLFLKQKSYSLIFEKKKPNIIFKNGFITNNTVSFKNELTFYFFVSYCLTQTLIALLSQDLQALYLPILFLLTCDRIIQPHHF